MLLAFSSVHFCAKIQPHRAANMAADISLSLVSRLECGSGCVNSKVEKLPDRKDFTSGGRKDASPVVMHCS